MSSPTDLPRKDPVVQGYPNHAVLSYYFGRTATALGRGVVAPEQPTTGARLGGLGLTDRERDVAELAVCGSALAVVARLNLGSGRRVRTRTGMVRMRLHVRDLGVEVQVLDDGVVGLGVLLRPAFIAGAHGPR
jgi:hypothetical protein